MVGVAYVIQWSRNAVATVNDASIILKQTGKLTQTARQMLLERDLPGTMRLSPAQRAYLATHEDEFRRIYGAAIEDHAKTEFAKWHDRNRHAGNPEIEGGVEAAFFVAGAQHARIFCDARGVLIVRQFFSWAMPIILGVLELSPRGWGWSLLANRFGHFFELKKYGLEVLILYGNVGARGVYLHDDHLQPVDPRIVEKEKRLQEAEAAFRRCGSKFQAFANTETGYQPLDAGRGFIGLSNTIGEHGQARSDNRTLIERSLKMAD